MKDEVFDTSEAIKDIWDKLAHWINSFVLNIPNILLAIIVFFTFVIIAKYIGKLSNRLLLKRRHMQQSVRSLSVRFLKLTTITIGFFFALSLLHLDTVLTSFLAGAGVMGLALGFALKGTLNNTVSGVILSFIPEIKVQDWVETSGFAGEVLEVNLRNILIKEADNNHVIIPNSKIVEGTFKNLSRTKRTRVMVKCRVSYDNNLKLIEKLVTKKIGELFKTEGKEVVEFAYQEFGDFSINFIVRFWADAQKQRDILFAKHKAIVAIKKAFDTEGVRIPYPIRSLEFDQNNLRSQNLPDSSDKTKK